MTQPLPAQPIGPLDAELAVAAGAGDSAALAAIFDRYAPALLPFCRSLVRNSADAEDCLQDVFVIAARRLAGLREPERLRSWLFAVARHTCLSRIAKIKKEVPVDAIVDSATSDDDEPASAAIDAQLRELLAAAIAGLSTRDRLVLELADRQGLDTSEVAAIVGLSPSTTYKVLSRARTTARHSIGALLVARTARADCPDLAAILGSWSGQLTPLLRKRLTHHVEECPVCSEQERKLVAPALFGTGPAAGIPLLLRSKILALASAASTPPPPAAGGAWRGGWPPTGPIRRRPAGVPLGAVAGLVVIVAGVAIGAGVWAVQPDDQAHPDALTSIASTKPPAVAPAAATPGATADPLGSIEPLATSGGLPLAPAAGEPVASSSSIHPTITTSKSTPKPTPTPAPTIASMTVSCVYMPTQQTSVPVLVWSTSHDSGVAISVDDPKVDDSYGHYGSSGSVALPAGGCIPSTGTHIYTLTTDGGVGPPASRTIRWTAPITP